MIRKSGPLMLRITKRKKHIKNLLKSNWLRNTIFPKIQDGRLNLLTIIFIYDFSTNHAGTKCNTSFWCVCVAGKLFSANIMVA